jgi:hypothetical protein
MRFPSVKRRVGPGFAVAGRHHPQVHDAHVDELLAVLAQGAQERPFLAQKLRLSDRRTRQVVEEARLRGHLVIWQRVDGGPRGLYRLAATRAAYEEWKRAEMRSRLGTLHDQLREMDQVAARQWPVEQQRLAI